jgi:hypothetical protein
MKNQTRNSLKYSIAFASLFAFVIALININPFIEPDLVFSTAKVQHAENNPTSDLHTTEILATKIHANPTNSNKKVHDFTPMKVEETFPAITTLMSSDLSADYDEASRAAFIEQFMQDVDPKIEEIYQSLQAMEKIDFPEKEKYKKIAAMRIQDLEELKARLQ